MVFWVKNEKCHYFKLDNTVNYFYLKVFQKIQFKVLPMMSTYSCLIWSSRTLSHFFMNMQYQIIDLILEEELMKQFILKSHTKKMKLDFVEIFLKS